jgi:hypothetical protein
MGINKFVGSVVLYEYTFDRETISQAAGRAGRFGNFGTCLLLVREQFLKGLGLQNQPTGAVIELEETKKLLLIRKDCFVKELHNYLDGPGVTPCIVRQKVEHCFGCCEILDSADTPGAAHAGSPASGSNNAVGLVQASRFSSVLNDTIMATNSNRMSQYAPAPIYQPPLLSAVSRTERSHSPYLHQQRAQVCYANQLEQDTWRDLEHALSLVKDVCFICSLDAGRKVGSYECFRANHGNCLKCNSSDHAVSVCPFKKTAHFSLKDCHPPLCYYCALPLNPKFEDEVNHSSIATCTHGWSKFMPLISLAIFKKNNVHESIISAAESTGLVCYQNYRTDSDIGRAYKHKQASKLFCNGVMLFIWYITKCIGDKM